MLTRTFANLGTVEPGFETRNLLAVQVTRDARDAPTLQQAEQIKNASEFVRTFSGVVDVTASTAVPFDQDSEDSLRYAIEGLRLDGPYHGMGAWRPVGSRYFETLRIPLVQGRTFTDTDVFNSLPVVIINKAMADLWWPHGDAIGHRLILGRGTGWDDAPREIVGIVANIRDESLDREPVPTNYVPIAQLRNTVASSVLAQVTWIVRTASGSGTVGTRIVEALQRSNAGMPTTSLGDVSSLMDRSRSKASFRMWLMMAFASTAVFLAAIGVYGVASYRVRQRTREIGIRLALGAERRDLVRSVLADSLRFSLVGVATGAALAVLAGRVLDALVFGLTSHDPTSFALSCSVLFLVATRRVRGSNRRAAMGLRWSWSSISPADDGRCFWASIKPKVRHARS
jgi:hypothetical protein